MLVILLSDDNELICLEVGTLDEMPDWLVIVLEVDLSAPTMCCDENNGMYMLQQAMGIQKVNCLTINIGLCKSCHLEHTVI